MLDGIIDELYAKAAVILETNSHGEHWKARSPKYGEIEGYQLDALEYVKTDDGGVIVRDGGVTVDSYPPGEAADFNIRNAIADYRG